MKKELVFLLGKRYSREDGGNSCIHAILIQIAKTKKSGITEKLLICHYNSHFSYNLIISTYFFVPISFVRLSITNFRPFLPIFLQSSRSS